MEKLKDVKMTAKEILQSESKDTKHQKKRIIPIPPTAIWFQCSVCSVLLNDPWLYQSHKLKHKSQIDRTNHESVLQNQCLTPAKFTDAEETELKAAAIKILPTMCILRRWEEMNRKPYIIPRPSPTPSPPRPPPASNLNLVQNESQHFTCPKCDLKFYSKFTAKRHLAKFHEDFGKIHICRNSKCFYWTRKRQDLLLHTKLNHFANESLPNQSSASSLKILPRNPRQVYQCKHCVLKFHHFFRMQWHLETAHGIVTNAAAFTSRKDTLTFSNSGEIREVFKCCLCNNIYSSEITLQRHVRKVHSCLIINDDGDSSIPNSSLIDNSTSPNQHHSSDPKLSGSGDCLDKMPDISSRRKTEEGKSSPMILGF